jgi:hypothetical protein
MPDPNDKKKPDRDLSENDIENLIITTGRKYRRALVYLILVNAGLLASMAVGLVTVVPMWAAGIAAGELDDFKLKVRNDMNQMRVENARWEGAIDIYRRRSEDLLKEMSDKIQKVSAANLDALTKFLKEMNEDPALKDRLTFAALAGRVGNLETGVDKEERLASDGSWREYQIGPSTFMRVLEGVTGTRSYVRVDHSLPEHSYVLSIAASCNTDVAQDAWENFLPIFQSTSVIIDSDVVETKYNAGWNKEYAFAQFPIDGTYAQKPVRITIVYSVK